MAKQRNTVGTDAEQWQPGPVDMPAVRRALEAWGKGARVDFLVSAKLFYQLVTPDVGNKDWFTFNDQGIHWRQQSADSAAEMVHNITVAEVANLDFPAKLSAVVRWYDWARSFINVGESPHNLLPSYLLQMAEAETWGEALAIVETAVNAAESDFDGWVKKLADTPKKPAMKYAPVMCEYGKAQARLEAVRAFQEALAAAEGAAQASFAGGVVVRIQGREAVPVRALPFITNWDLSPEPLAELLNDTSARWHTDSVKQRPPWSTTYQLLPSGQFRKIKPREWDQVVVALKGFDSRLDATEHDEHDGYAQWRKNAMTHFPAGCFVWKDEFETSVNNPNKVFWPDPDETGAGELNYTPLFLDDTREMVMAGFEPPAQKPAPSPQVSMPEWAGWVPSKNARRPQCLVIEAINGLRKCPNDLQAEGVLAFLRHAAEKKQYSLEIKDGKLVDGTRPGKPEITKKQVTDQLKTLRKRQPVE